MRNFWMGAAAGFAFLAIQLLGRLLGGTPTIPELIQDRLVLTLPGPVFSFVLDRLLYLGKPAFFAGLLLVQVGLAGLGGLVAARWKRPGLMSLLLWLATGFIVLPLAGQGIFANSPGVALESFLSFLVYAGALIGYGAAPPDWLLRHSGPSVDDALETPTTRREASRRAAIGGLSTFVASVFLARSVVGTLPALPPRPGDQAASPGSGATPAPGDTGLPPMITPPDRFYVVSKNLVDPVVDATSWRLTVTGMVSKSLNLTYDDVLALPAQQIYRTLECISNEVGGDLISNGQWTGVALSDVLKLAGVGSGATTIHFTSVDGYTENMDLAKALDPSTLLVYKLGGQPLPSKHGFPVRVLGAGTYGMKNPKWLTKIEITTSAPAGFWESQGWNPDAIVQTMSRVDAPGNGAVLRMGPVGISGIAFAGARGIKQVDVSTDGGASWNPANLQPTLGPNTWTFWRYSWQPGQAGSRTLITRATDGTGQTQTSRETDTFPSGATGYHRVTVQVIS